MSTRDFLRSIAVVLGLGIAPVQVQADFLSFDSLTPANNSATRASWLSASGIVTPQYLVNFESGFTNNQNISGLTGLFPAGLVITDTSSANAAIIRSGAGSINGSNPVGVFSLTQNEEPFLDLSFSANPVDYVGFLDIDQAGIAGIVTFVGGATAGFVVGATPGSGDSAQFFGIFHNDRPRITRIQLDASGDGLWGIDNIEYGFAVTAAVPEPASLAMTGIGLAGSALIARRRLRSEAARP